jgi:hypothetical protein
MSFSPHSPITTEQRLPLPLNGTVYTTVREVATEKPLPEIGITMAGELGNAWANSRIISAVKNPIKGQQGKQLVIRHAVIPSETDQLSSNWEFSTCDMGGTRFPSVSRTFVLLASAVAHDTPAKGSAMPFVEGDLFDGKGYILVDRQVVRSGMELEPTFRVERRSYVIKSAMKSLGVDPLNGKMLTSTTTLYYATEVVTGGLTAADLFAAPTNAFWGLQTDGTQRTGQQLSCGWYAVTQETVVAGVITDGIVAVDSFETNDNYFWPPVLESFLIKEWTRRDGGVDKYPFLRFEPDGYSGPCKTLVTRTWSKDAVSIPKVAQMLPTGVRYGAPFYNLNIPECLHVEFEVECDIGNNDPVYTANAGSTETFAATNYLVWPASIIAYDEQTPFRGGYLRTRREVFKPA